METNRETVRKSFSFLKKASSLQDWFSKIIPFENGRGGLLPVGQLHMEDHDLIRDLASWRESHQSKFPTRFSVSQQGTRQWLHKLVLSSEERILFLVLDEGGYRVGHLGYVFVEDSSFVLEVDNVVRGVAGRSPGIMGLALNTMLRWAQKTLGAEGFVLRALSDNERAIEFYKTHSFCEEKSEPLWIHNENDEIKYLPITTGGKKKPDSSMLHMRWKAPRHDPKRMILTAGPSISEREVNYAFHAAMKGWNQSASEYLDKFEKTFAEYLGARFCIPTSSCTGALHIALAALGIGPGDEVVVPEITWVATANAVRYVGATPVFADVEEDTWCLDPASFEKKISARTKAVIPVHLYGQPARMDRIMEVAQKYDLLVVEDAAPAIGAFWKKQKVGTFGDFACFSFQGAKMLVAGEGGAIVTNNEDLFQRAKKIWDQGRNPSRQFWIDSYGLKYKMANIQAALALAQVERCAEQIEMKRRIFGWYQEGLQDCPEIEMHAEPPESRSIYWMSSCLLTGKIADKRGDLLLNLKKRNIDSRIVFPCNSQYPLWGEKLIPEPRATLIAERAFNLPSGATLEKSQIEYICDTIRKVSSLM